jgi:hypothetical protein
MQNLVNIIDEITKFGLIANLESPAKEVDLEKNLVNFYAQYFGIDYNFDETEYPDYQGPTYSNIRKNVKNNFTDFTFYNEFEHLLEISAANKTMVRDSSDDLTDIILDLLEIKWRIENNSIADGLWFFEFIFRSHTQYHMIGLLNYLKNKNG